MPATKAKGRQSGMWFELKSIAETIRIKEANGKDATFERNLLKEWSKVKGYESAKDYLAKMGKPFRQA